MVSKSLKVTACALMAAAAVMNVSLTAEASNAGSVLPSGGVGLSLTNNATPLNNIAGTENKNVKVTTTVTANATLASVSSGDVSEQKKFENLVIAQVNDYVNIRNLPGETGEIVGKLYDDSVGEKLAVVNGWYKIKSGNVTGFVKAEYCVTGEEAVELAEEVGTKLAKVTTTTLNVRKEPSLDASIIGLVPIDDELLVEDEADGWVQVDTQEGLGWVSTEFVEVHTEFVEAESKEEEEARLAKEAEERRKARQAAAAAAPKAAVTVTATVTPNENSSEMGIAVAEYALQFVGNPYVYGGTSLTQGADCSGFVMSVYANFGVSLPHSSAADRNQGYAVDGGLENAQPGDLICYSGHVALYIGDGQIVHASTSKTGIIVSKADYKKILAIRRIF